MIGALEHGLLVAVWFFHSRDCTDGRDSVQALDQWVDNIPQRQKVAWQELVKAVSNWSEEMLPYFETDTRSPMLSLSRSTAWPMTRTAMAESTHSK